MTPQLSAGENFYILSLVNPKLSGDGAIAVVQVDDIDSGLEVADVQLIAVVRRRVFHTDPFRPRQVKDPDALGRAVDAVLVVFPQSVSTV